MLAPGDLVDGRYKVLSQLGEGGMGAVFVVEHTHMRKRMALKVLHPHVQSPEILARFEREAMAAANIEHPNVVTATDFGRTQDGGFFMVLEYIDGASLRRVLEGGPLPEARAAAIARQVTSALAKAHELGIVHRDLKPDNVMLVPRDGAELVKVLDFGIAKVDDLAGTGGPALTQAGAVFGTPEYMAPEQAQGLAVDARADLYALGVMLFEMVSGRLPIDGADFVELLTKRVTEDAPALRSVAPHASPAMEALVARLLARELSARPASARDVLAALDALAETPPPVSISAPSGAALPSSANASLPSMGLMKTQLPDAAPASMRVVAQVPAPVRALSARAWAALPEPVRKLPRPALIGGAVALALAPIALVVVIALALRPSPSAAQQGHPTTTSAAPEVPAGPTDAEVARAKAAGPDGLEALARKYPSDARVARARLSALVEAKRWADAVDASKRLIALDASAASSREVADAATNAALSGAPGDLDAAVALMTGPMGPAGVDLLIDLSGRAGLAPATKTRLGQALADPDARAHASAAAAVYLDLRATKKCDERRALLDRAAKDGDARALPALEAMQRKSGCGFLGLSDCWGCMRKDAALDDAVAAVRARR